MCCSDSLVVDSRFRGNDVLVEDEKLCAMIAEAILSDLGKKVDIAENSKSTKS